jgi:hypothetical protein
MPSPTMRFIKASAFFARSSAKHQVIIADASMTII